MSLIAAVRCARRVQRLACQRADDRDVGGRDGVEDPSCRVLLEPLTR
jgi:hypothetical protein